MDSLTKRRLDRPMLDALCSRLLGGASVVDAAELTGGMFNAAYRLRLDDGREAVLKASPPAEAPLLSYEQGIMRTEAEVFRRLAAAAEVPAAEVLAAGTGGDLLDADVLVTAALPGRPWNEAAADLGPGDHRALRHRLGRVLAAMHTVRSDAARGDVAFGYPQRSAGLHGADWASAFTAMTEALLADGRRWGVELPEARVRTALARHRAALDEVEAGVLVHFDLWPGNVFVDAGENAPGAGPAGGADRPRITGIIDVERAWWGDPLADLVGMDPFGSAEEDADLLAGYREAGTGLDVSSPEAALRLALYRVYLGLIMVVEIAPRGYSGDWVAEYTGDCRALLARGLDALESPRGPEPVVR
ncbi:phosphotransferase family protein [Streptomonospora litoralis]|uniref:Phosphotransferase enzyme family protein n=1 Tax=Streptomonospora litoralis TaxID=2498135 RepID=A0A4P6QAE4_9ACTN|nr:phosphotransferase [Streptomonospora litoralis]QBI56404.1 Phosphotransferase enzyme family protein [Streptomonospora litoralis]